MSRPSTTRDIQRATFVESLHTSLKKQAEKAVAEYQKFMTLASSYLEDGLSESECIELLMIDGLSRDASESYISSVLSDEKPEFDNLHEYSFQFEDVYGKIYSSYDVGKIIRASGDNDAWDKAEELIDSEEGLEAQKIISVNRIN